MKIKGRARRRWSCHRPFRISFRSTHHECCDNNSRKKSVKFDNHDEYIVVPSRKQYTSEELHSMFLSKKDRLRIQEDRKYTLQSMEQGIFPNDDSDYFRGLENRMNHRNRDVRSRIKAARNAILENQEYSDDFGTTIDPDWIETCYRRITYSSSVTARRVACFDALQSCSKCAVQ